MNKCNKCESNTTRFALFEGYDVIDVKCQKMTDRLRMIDFFVLNFNKNIKIATKINYSCIISLVLLLDVFADCTCAWESHCVESPNGNQHVPTLRADFQPE